MANDQLESQRKQLQALNEALQRAGQYKSDFLANVSHELKTPLTSILAFTDIWEKSLARGDGESVKIALCEIKENSQKLLQMVKNILEVSKAEAGCLSVDLVATDMDDLALSVESTMRPIAEKRGVALSFKVDPSMPVVYADFDKIHAIVENIVSNAVRFCDAGGLACLNVSYDFEAGQLVIRMKDTGVGIKEENLPYIFDRFSQTNHALNKQGGAVWALPW